MGLGLGYEVMVQAIGYSVRVPDKRPTKQEHNVVIRVRVRVIVKVRVGVKVRMCG